MDQVRSLLYNDAESRFRAPIRLVGGTVVFAVGLVSLQALIAVLAGVAGFDPRGADPFVVQSVALALSVPAALALASVVARAIDRRKLTDYGLDLDRQWYADLAFGLALGGALQTAVFVVGVAAGWFRITGFLVGEGFLGAMVAMVALFVAVGIVEELLLRGWLLTNLAEGLRFAGRRAAVAGAILLSSGAFGLLHSANPNASVLSATTLTLAGVFLALGYVLTGELGLPIGVHVTWNFFQGPVFGLGVSGYRMPASVVGVEPTGPEAVTGGAFGPEAGLLGVGAVLLGSAAIVYWVRRREGRSTIDAGVTAPDLRQAESE